MKILNISTAVPRDDARWRRIFNIARILEDNGNVVKFVHYCKKSHYDKLKNKEEYSGHTFVITSPLTVNLKHIKILSQDHFDLVYANAHYGAFSCLLGKLTKTPLIFDMHGDEVEEFLLERGTDLKNKISSQFIQKKVIDFFDLRFSDKIICVSNRMVENLHFKKGIPKEKLVYIPNGVNLNYFRHVNLKKVENLKDQMKLNDKFIVGYVGNLQKWQGVESFIEAARKIRDENIALLVVGGENKIKENNLIVHPKVPFAQITKYYSICDVLILPRPRHPATEVAAPTKFAEYAAIGKPILTTDIGDAANFVKEYKCGIVVKDNQPENLISGINAFKSKSNKDLKEMGRNSRLLAKKEFDWEKVGTRLLKAIDSFN
jgi:glycosyltransferase involved in cell wall biosynthesis